MKILLIYHSSTDAQAARRILSRNGISATVTKAPEAGGGRGCMPAVRIDERSLSAARMLLTSLPWDQICRVGDDGRCAETI